MAEPTPTPTPSLEPAPPVEGTLGGTQAPEGFVPVADLEREQARARSFQADADRAKAELAARGPVIVPGKPEGDGPAPLGFDPVEFRRSLLSDTANVLQMTSAISDLKVRFPNADPAIYSRVDEYGNPDALRLAVEDSHLRVTAQITAAVEAREVALRKEYDEKIGGGAPPGSAPGALVGDPTVESLRAMTGAELHAFDKANPGVVERVLSSA